jgi:hypothetical protein
MSLERPEHRVNITTLIAISIRPLHLLGGGTMAVKSERNTTVEIQGSVLLTVVLRHTFHSVNVHCTGSERSYCVTRPHYRARCRVCAFWLCHTTTLPCTVQILRVLTVSHTHTTLHGADSGRSYCVTRPHYPARCRFCAFWMCHTPVLPCMLSAIEMS